MDEALLAAYRATEYRVRLARGGWAVIHVDQPLPVELHPLAQTLPWGFITAWNPRSELAPRATNRQAQHALLAHLRALPETMAIRPGVGVSGDGGWKEPSFWVVGPTAATLDPLARRFGQLGYVHGEGASPAQLRLTPAT
ncbi:DUF3293 domain-containing protein [Dyella japonica]|uniref:DUF3293 domain-containing protein n=1 Tax=Dyella japonica TaxID=231455 RepID=A0ABV2K0M6_9GAMM